MTTSRSSAPRRPARRLAGAAAAAALLPLLAAPAAAQAVALPSGHAATLFDVVLEEGGEAIAPDASIDPESLEEGPLDESEAFDAPPAGAAGAEAEAEAAPRGGLARFRFLLPELGGEGAAYEDVAEDFAWLCAAVALPALAANGWAPTEVVVSLSDRETAFGVTDPDAVQFFEGFRIGDGACVPQAY